MLRVWARRGRSPDERKAGRRAACSERLRNAAVNWKHSVHVYIYIYHESISNTAYTVKPKYGCTSTYIHMCLHSTDEAQPI